MSSSVCIHAEANSVMEEIFDIEKRGFHNMRAAAIVRSRPKPMEFKVKCEIHLTIENRQAQPYVAKYSYCVSIL